MTKSLFRIRDSLVLLPHYTSSGLIIAKSYSELLYAVLCTDCFLSSKKKTIVKCRPQLKSVHICIHISFECQLQTCECKCWQPTTRPLASAEYSCFFIFQWNRRVLPISTQLVNRLNWNVEMLPWGIGACVSGSKKYQRVTQEKLIQIWNIVWDFSCKLRKDG